MRVDCRLDEFPAGGHTAVQQSEDFFCFLHVSRYNVHGEHARTVAPDRHKLFKIAQLHIALFGDGLEIAFARQDIHIGVHDRICIVRVLVYHIRQDLVIRFYVIDLLRDRDIVRIDRHIIGVFLIRLPLGDLLRNTSQALENIASFLTIVCNQRLVGRLRRGNLFRVAQGTGGRDRLERPGHNRHGKHPAQHHSPSPTDRPEELPEVDLCLVFYIVFVHGNSSFIF